MRYLAVSAAVLMMSACGAAHSQAHEVLLLVNPNNAESLHISNYYADARGVPMSGLAYFDPATTDYTGFVASRIPALDGTIANHRNKDSIDYIILTPDAPYRISAPGLVSDGCVAVSRFSLAGCYTFARHSSTVLAGTGSLLKNGYFDVDGDALAFDSNLAYHNGSPGAGTVANRPYIGAALGYTGSLGNTRPEILSLIDTSVAADGSFPAGTFYFLQTSDTNRSGPRHGLYSSAAGRITSAGGVAIHSSGPTLPPAGATVAGAMSGAATLAITAADMTFVDGAFADHLTSFAATFDNGAQTKVSRWIAKGAVCSFGTIQEPCNYPDKFPTAYIHSMYFDGLTIGEACLRSLEAVPFQGMMYGDPLCRAYTHIPVVNPGSIPSVPVSGNINITPSATTTHPTASIASYEVYIDGVLRAAENAGSPLLIRTAFLDDGWHELRIVAFDDTPAQSQGVWVGELYTDNQGKIIAASAPAASIDRSGLIQMISDANDPNVTETRLLHNDRVVAAFPGKGTVTTTGEIVGAGPARVRIEMDFADGSTARSQPFTVEVSNTNAPATTGSPTAFSYNKVVLPGKAYVVELPAIHTSVVNEPTFTITQSPSQGTILGGAGRYRIVQANSGALGTDQILYKVTSNGQDDFGAVNIVFYDPASQPCPADTNFDGTLDAADFTFWVFAYNSGLVSIADLNGNGTLEPGDFSAWIAAYNTGCDF